MKKMPETIIYGGGAVGGVVNIIDYRIHPEFIDGIVGKYDARTGGANNATAGSVLVDIGANNLMLHIDLYNRDSKNTKIPGGITEHFVYLTKMEFFRINHLSSIFFKHYRFTFH